MPEKRFCFQEWLVRVDSALWKRCGKSVNDFPETPYRSWWQDGMDCESAATKIGQND
jgi:hypothetical protein